MKIRSAALTGIGAILVAGLSVCLGGPGSPASGAVVPVSVASAAPTDDPSVTYRPPRIRWRACADESLTAGGARCGVLRVPLDWDDPNGERISVAVSRVLHTRGTTGRGAVFTNPGGPGGSGTYLATYGQYVPDKVGLTYDWYGMDPRGVGESRPVLSCDPGFFGWDRPDYNPTSRAILRYWKNKSERYARACATAPSSRLIGHLSTVDNVRDFEALREAIGEEKVTFYGFSYGTYLEQVYATLYPDSLKALIMDGVVDPTRAFYASNLDQDRAFETTIARFFAWVARHRDVYHLGRTRQAVTKRYYRLRAQLIRTPAGGGKVGPDELDDFTLVAGYYNLVWLDVAQGLSDLANKGMAGAIKADYRSTNPVGKNGDNGFAIYLATQCSDAPWPDSFAAITADNRRVARNARFFTWGNAWFNGPCRTFPGPQGPRVDVDGTDFTGPVLVLSETRDAATPFSGALKARSLFPTASLVAGKNGTSHAVSLFGVACTDDTVAAVLRNGRLPTRVSGNRADKVCEPLAPPDPTADRAVPRRPLLSPGRF